MNLQSLPTAAFELPTKRTCKRKFLDEMNLVVPLSEVGGLIQPYAPAGKLDYVLVSARVVQAHA